MDIKKICGYLHNEYSYNEYPHKYGNGYRADIYVANRNYLFNYSFSKFIVSQKFSFILSFSSF